MLMEDELFENYYLDEEEIIIYNDLHNSLYSIVKSSLVKSKALSFLDSIIKK